MPAALSPAALPSSARLPLLDMLRAFASQLLVWHHLAFYGPLADLAYPLAPVLLDWLVDPARLVVQVFLVMGGYGTAQHLARLRTVDGAGFWHEIIQRYRRIGLPYCLVLPLAVCANLLAGHWMDHHSISAAPTLPQVLAHALFAQDVLRYESLSAGIWYLAIDFQLFVLCLGVALLSLWLTRHSGHDQPTAALRLMQGLLTGAAALSLFWFNRHPAYDCWGFYFLGSYFLGMLVQWVLSGSLPVGFLAGYLCVVAAALAVDWRPRLLVAVGTALLILVAGRSQRWRRWPDSRVIGYLARISFSLFLIHFPACLVVSAWLSRWSLTPGQALAGMVAAWGVSVLMAILVHHLVELPVLRRTAQPRSTATHRA